MHAQAIKNRENGEAPSNWAMRHAALQKLAPSLARAASETAGAFFCADTYAGFGRKSVPRFADFEAMHCSQRNIGEKHDMICDLAVNRKAWNRLFSGDESEDLKRDAFSELANCICGVAIADPEFTESVGYLIPCVPCSGPSALAPGAAHLQGAFKMGGAWIRYAFSLCPAQASRPTLMSNAIGMREPALQNAA